MRKGETALVVGGATALGQAAVTLLQALSCTVVATASDERQRATIRARFPDLDVVVGSVEQYCRELRRRAGGPLCVDLALVQGGPAELQGVMRILNKYGRAVHVGADHAVISQALGE